jgi:hypothetical protein
LAMRRRPDQLEAATRSTSWPRPFLGDVRNRSGGAPGWPATTVEGEVSIMKPTYLLYLAAKAEEPATRCCDDRVPQGYRSSGAIDRPVAPRRWASKVRTAVPMSLRVFRRSLRLPVGAAADVGMPVLRRDGSRVGRLEDVMIGLESGRARYAVAMQTKGAEVILLPDRAVRAESGRRALIVDERALDPDVRRALLAAS